MNGDTFIYYIEGNPRRSVSPDCYVVLGLSDEAIESIERNNVYLLWEVGKAPDFILEIGSESTASADSGRKRELYAELGVSEYWRYDATGGDFYGDALIGERLVEGEYRRFETEREEDGRVWSHSDVLNLDLWWDDGVLRFRDSVSGQWLLSHEEEKQRADREKQRADREQQRADREKQRADAAEASIAELRAKLRQARDD